MAARITRVKKKISTARIPYLVPTAADLPHGVGAVLRGAASGVHHRHTAPIGKGQLRQDLVHQAVELTRLVHRLLPDDSAVMGLLALMLLDDARRDARLSPDGDLVLLADQDRRRWDQPKISEGIALVRASLDGHRPTRYAVQAAITALHAEAPAWSGRTWDLQVGVGVVVRTNSADHPFLGRVSESDPWIWSRRGDPVGPPARGNQVMSERTEPSFRSSMVSRAGVTPQESRSAT